MKNFCTVLIGIFVAAATAYGEKAPTYPKLFFQYSFLYDGICAGNNPVDPRWAEEAESREAEFTQLWEKEAPTLFRQLFADFGKGFSRNEMTATLSVCPQAPSFSDPLVLNVTRFLKSYMQDRPVRPDYVFVDLVFHELLHTWLIENLKRPTPLLTKYKDEAPSVRSHLHLMAVQILIYSELGRSDLLQWLSDYYPKMGGAYPRAWQIVHTEGYQAFVSEIRSSPQF